MPVFGKFFLYYGESGIYFKLYMPSYEGQGLGIPHRG